MRACGFLLQTAGVSKCCVRSFSPKGAFSWMQRNQQRRDKHHTSEIEARGGVMAAPKPGKPVREPRTGRPIMELLDLLGRRWALRIIWELRDEPFGFRALQARCDGMSPSVLSQRLLELQAAGIV